MYIPMLLGIARERRLSEKAAIFVKEEAEKFGLETKIIDLGLSFKCRLLGEF